MNKHRRLTALFLFIFSLLLITEAAFAVEFTRPRSLLGEDICRMALAPNGEIYTFSPLGNGALGYRVISADLTHEYHGQIVMAGEVLNCPQSVVMAKEGHSYILLSSQNHSLVFAMTAAGNDVTATKIYQSDKGRIPAKLFLKNSDTTLYVVTGSRFSSREDSSLEAIDIASQAKQTLTRLYRENQPQTALSPNGLIYLASKRPAEGLWMIRAQDGEREGFIAFPTARLTHQSVHVEVSTPVFDPATGEGYSYYHSIAAINDVDAGREWGIWRFNATTHKSDIIFRKAGVGKLQSLKLQQGRLYILAGGELMVFHLSEPERMLEKRWTQTETIIAGRPLASSHDYYKLRWEVRDEQNRIRQQGDILLDSADQQSRNEWLWPLRVAAKINAQQAFLQAGEREKNRHIHPLASSYRNHLWLPVDLLARGWTVTLSDPEVDNSAPVRTQQWLSNPVADFNAINLAAGEVLSSRVCLRLDKRQGGNEYVTLSPLNTDNRYRWSYDLASAINRSPARAYIAAGEFSQNQMVPLYSQFRNRLWLKRVSDDPEGINYNKYSGFSYQQGRCPES